MPGGRIDKATLEKGPSGRALRLDPTRIETGARRRTRQVLGGHAAAGVVSENSVSQPLCEILAALSCNPTVTAEL